MVHINNNVEGVSGGYQPHSPPPPPQNSASPVVGDPPAAVHVHVNQSYTQQPGMRSIYIQVSFLFDWFNCCLCGFEELVLDNRKYYSLHLKYKIYMWIWLSPKYKTYFQFFSLKFLKTFFLMLITYQRKWVGGNKDILLKHLVISYYFN